MSNAPAIVLLAQSGDPAATPLAVWLGRDGTQVTVAMTPDTVSADQTVWFADHVAFLLHAPALANHQMVCNLVLRPGMDTGRQMQGIALAVGLAKRLFGESVTYWSLSVSSARMIEATYGLSVTALSGAVSEAKQDAPDLELSVTSGLLRDTSGSEITMSLRAANLARLSRRYRLRCEDPEAIEEHDLIAIANSTVTGRPDRRNRVLFILPGGAGLGHISRSLAVADALQGTACDFLVYNDAAYIAADAGHRVYHRQSATQLNVDSDAWRQWETAALAGYLARERPAAVIVDASHIDPYIIEALAQPGAENTQLVWIRREMWRSDRQAAWGAYAAFADLVIVPGELSQPEPPQRPALPPCHDVAPIVFKGPHPYRTRRQLRRALGLKRGPACLVSLGGWNSALPRELIASAAEQARVQMIWAESPLATASAVGPSPGATLYPMSAYLGAFDGVISAAGYNSFHELMLGFDGPVLFLPVDQRGLDDQVGRAGFAAQSGLADSLTPETAQDVLTRFFGKLRTGIPARPTNRQAGGAVEAATLIASRIQPCLETPDD